MRHMNGQEFWEVAKVAAIAAALILLTFGVVLGLGDELAFPERQRVTVLRERIYSPAPADQVTRTAAVPEGVIRDPPGARRAQDGGQAECLMR